MKAFLFLLAFFLIAGTAVSYGQQRKTKHITVTPRKADKVMAKKEVVVLDVRTPEEIALGQLPDAVSLDFKSPDFQQKLSDLPKDKPYLVYCRSGNRSGKTVELMKTMGFIKVYDLKGGYDAYKESKAEK